MQKLKQKLKKLLAKTMLFMFLLTVISLGTIKMFEEVYNFEVGLINYFAGELPKSYLTTKPFEVKEVLAKEPIKEKKGVLTILGKASYYDYILDSGWSSLGHYVCATRDFERYSMVRVTNLDNDKKIDCKVTDYVENPDVIIDLSSTAFADLAPLHLGIINVLVEQL